MEGCCGDPKEDDHPVWSHPLDLIGATFTCSDTSVKAATSPHMDEFQKHTKYSFTSVLLG